MPEQPSALCQSSSGLRIGAIFPALYAVILSLAIGVATARGGVSVKAPQAQVPLAEVERDEYAIYALVLAEQIGPQTTELTIRPYLHADFPMTRTIDRDGGVKELEPRNANEVLEGLEEGTFHGFRTRAPGRIVAGRLKLTVPIVLDWSASTVSYRLSRVGFNEKRTQGLLFVDFHCVLCGKGYTYLLEKRAGRWTIAKKVMRWIS